MIFIKSSTHYYKYSNLIDKYFETSDRILFGLLSQDMKVIIEHSARDVFISVQAYFVSSSWQ
jgi:hypothetical protein